MSAHLDRTGVLRRGRQLDRIGLARLSGTAG